MSRPTERFTQTHPATRADAIAMTLTKRAALVASLVLPFALGACGRADDSDEFREGVPTHDDVALAFPSSGGASQQSALVAAGGITRVQGALLGQTAELYTITRDITGVVNGATAAVLTLVKTITAFPPTTVETDVAVWGPYTDPLSPNTWRLTVNRLAPGQFQYALAAKPRTAADTAYLTILSGQHNRSNPAVRRRVNLPDYGSGNFLLDWDAAQMLPEHDDNVGKAAFTYSRATPISEVDISVAFTQIRDQDTGMLVDAHYDYVATPGAGGTFQFGVNKDAITTTPALEALSVRSRWQETGTGRSDVQLSGGDLGTQVATSSECWSSGDTGFASIYETNSYGDPAKLWGDVASCAFSTAEYASF